MPDQPEMELRLSESTRRAPMPSHGSRTVHQGGLLVLDEMLDGASDLGALQAQDLLDSVSELVLVVEPTGRIVYANRSATLHTDLHEQGFVSGSLERLVIGVERGPVWYALETAGEWTGRRPARLPDGSASRLAFTIRAERRDAGDIATLLVTALDVGEQEALSRALGHRVTHDALTGLPNRQHLLTLVDRVLTTSPMCVRGVLALVDIRDFGAVSAALGHDVGDRVLRAFARRLAATFPDESILARVDGDTFAIFCTDRGSPEALGCSVERLTDAPFYVNDNEIHLQVTTGIAARGHDQRTVDASELLRRADMALESARSRSRMGYELFNPRTAPARSTRLEVAAGIRRALTRRELEVHYQPKVCLATGTIVGVEALLRWRLPTGELVGPDAFLQVAEDTGLIVPVGRFVLEEVAQMAGNLEAEVGQTLDIAMNLSIRELEQPDFVEEVEDVIARSGTSLARLELEVTESALIGDVDAIAARLRVLRALGTRISIDDFGTGYSSLKHLLDLPVDVLKVDREFVNALGTRHGAVVRTVVQMARSLRLECVAEGVETSAQLAELRRLGCEAAQGYYFSAPMGGSDLLDLVATAPRW